MEAGKPRYAFRSESHTIDNNKPEEVREHPAHHFTLSHVQKITKRLVHAYGLSSIEYNHPHYKPPNWDDPKTAILPALRRQRNTSVNLIFFYRLCEAGVL